MISDQWHTNLNSYDTTPFSANNFCKQLSHSIYNTDVLGCKNEKKKKTPESCPSFDFTSSYFTRYINDLLLCKTSQSFTRAGS